MILDNTFVLFIVIFALIAIAVLIQRRKSSQLYSQVSWKKSWQLFKQQPLTYRLSIVAIIVELVIFLYVSQLYPRYSTFLLFIPFLHGLITFHIFGERMQGMHQEILGKTEGEKTFTQIKDTFSFGGSLLLVIYILIPILNYIEFTFGNWLLFLLIPSETTQYFLRWVIIIAILVQDILLVVRLRRKK